MFERIGGFAKCCHRRFPFGQDRIKFFDLAFKGFAGCAQTGQRVADGGGIFGGEDVFVHFFQRALQACQRGFDVFCVFSGEYLIVQASYGRIKTLHSLTQLFDQLFDVDRNFTCGLLKGIEAGGDGADQCFAGLVVAVLGFLRAGDGDVGIA